MSTGFERVMQGVRRGVATHVDDQRTRAADGLTGIADLVGQIGEEFRGPLSQFSKTASSQLRVTADRIREHEAAELARSLARFAQDRPLHVHRRSLRVGTRARPAAAGERRPMSVPTAADRSIGDLLRDLLQQASTLIRQELELARTEVGERASALVSDGVWIGAGVLLLHTALVHRRGGRRPGLGPGGHVVPRGRRAGRRRAGGRRGLHHPIARVRDPPAPAAAVPDRGFDQGDRTVAERPGELAESERIRQDIDLTRERMSGTIDEIQERLHPARLLHDATASVRDAGVDSVKRVFEQRDTRPGEPPDQAKAASAAAAGYARTHPLPTALLLAGLALVVAKALGGRRTTPSVDDVDDVPNGDRSAANDIRLRPEYQDWGEPSNGSRPTACVGHELDGQEFPGRWRGRRRGRYRGWSQVGQPAGSAHPTTVRR